MSARAVSAATRITAVLAGLTGLANIVSAWFARAPGRLEALRQVLPLQVMHGSRTLAAVAGVFLVLTAKGLWRHKRRSWEMAIAILAASVVLHLVKGLDYEESLLAIILILLLVIEGPHYQVRSDPPSLRHGLAITLAALCATLLYGSIGFHLLDRQFTGEQTLPASVRSTLAVFFEFADINVRPLTHRARWFEDSLYWVALFTLTYGFATITRPLLPRVKASEVARQEMEALLVRYGETDIANFCLLDDKSYFFGSEHTCGIAYKVVANCAIALGDPIGPADSIPRIIGEFLALCQTSDWHAVFYQTTGKHLQAYREMGLKAVKIGEDALIDLETFSVRGNRGAGFRHTLNQLEKKQGVRAIRYDLATDELGLVDELEEVSTAWLAVHRGSEKTFSLGYWDRERVSRYPMMVALDSDNHVLAFETLVPMYTAHGWAGDLMRRRPDSPRGVMDYLVVRQALMLQQEGYRVYGQGLSPLSRQEVADENDDQRLVGRAIDLLYEHFNTFYGFKGLHEWKAKFHPRWESRYLIYPSVALLPRIALAIIQADSTEGLFAFLKTGRRPA